MKLVLAIGVLWWDFWVHLSILSYHLQILICWLDTSFVICIPLTSFCCLVASEVMFRTLLNSGGKSGQPCLVPDFSGIDSSFSPFSLMLAIGFLCIAFTMFMCGSWVAVLSNTFIMKGCWILSNDFSASNEMTMCLFSLIFYIVDYVALTYIEPSLPPWDEAPLIVMNILICSWIQFLRV